MSSDFVVRRFLLHRPAATRDDMVSTGRSLYYRMCKVAEWKNRNLVVYDVTGAGPTNLRNALERSYNDSH